MDERHNSYKDMLLDVSQMINNGDLQRMKFKCDQVIKKRQNEKITQATDLFTALEERGYLNETNVEFVKNLLKTCCAGKVDGIRALENYERVYIPGFVPTVPQAHPQAQAPHLGQANVQLGPGIPQASGQQIVYVVQNGNVPDGILRTNQQRPRYEGPDLSKEISFLCTSLGRDWKFFFRSLGLPEAEIEIISLDYRTVRERIHQCLLAWQHQEQQGASRYKLIAALRHSSVQRNDLASKLEEGRY